jgi:hypothetical protein
VRIEDPWAHSAFALGVGFIWIYSATTVIALFQLLSPLTGALVVLFPLLFFMRDHFEILLALRGARLRIPPDPSGRLVVAFLVAYGLMALTPPMWIDPLSYHLALPKQYIAAGGFARDYSNLFHSFPSAMSMQYTLLMLLGSDWLPKLLHAVYLGMMLVVFRWFLAQHASDWVARNAMLLFIAQWSVLHAILRANVEFYWGFFGLGSIVVLVDAILREDSPFRQRWMVLSGLFLGAAVAGKLQAVNAVSGTALLLSWALATRAIRLRTAVAFAASAAIAYLPIALRNVMFGTEPFFLFFPSLAPGWLAPDSMEAARFAAVAQWRDLFLTRPGAATAVLLPVFTFVNGAFPTTNFDAFLDPFYIPALLILPFILRGRPALRYVTIYGIGFYVSWFLTAPLTRYLFPALPLLAFVTATALGSVLHWAKAAQRERLKIVVQSIVPAFAIICLASVLIDQRALVGHALPGFLGLEPREYFERISGAYAHRQVTEEIRRLEVGDNMVDPEEARVFYIFESRVYFLDRPYYSDPFYVNLVLLRDGVAGGEPPLDYLRQRHFRYVVTDFGRLPWLRNERNWNPWLNPYPEGLNRLEALVGFWRSDVQPQLIHRGTYGTIDLYEVPPVQAPLDRLRPSPQTLNHPLGASLLQQPWPPLSGQDQNAPAGLRGMVMNRAHRAHRFADEFLTLRADSGPSERAHSRRAWADARPTAQVL